MIFVERSETKIKSGGFISKIETFLDGRGFSWSCQYSAGQWKLWVFLSEIVVDAEEFILFSDCAEFTSPSLDQVWNEFIDRYRGKRVFVPSAEVSGFTKLFFPSDLQWKDSTFAETLIHRDKEGCKINLSYYEGEWHANVV